MNIAFIVASPRSGTTFLEEIFNLHPNVCGWHEPYFIWKYYLSSKPNDYLDESFVTDKIKKFVRKEFELYLSKSNKTLLLEKTPTNAFKIRFINEIFPEAKWIHIYRDGRDVISSMKVRYEFRKNLVLNKNLRQFISDVYFTLQIQPFWRHRIMAILHELKNTDHIRPYLHLSSSQWKKTVGWGPRYPGWEIDKEKLSEIEFMAYQWIKSEEFIQHDLKTINNNNNVLQLKYEELLENPELQFAKLTNFLNLSNQKTKIMSNNVKQDNSNKWKTSLSTTEINLINPIISEMLHHYDY